jgi:hypothetical protein
MGWTYFHREKSQSVKDTLMKEFRSDKWEWLDFAVVKFRTAYAAIRNKETGEVFALVCLLGYRKNDYYNFGYKDMDETMGPCESECPQRILKLLTPTDSEWANQWRKRCQDYHERRAAKRQQAA